MGRGELSWGVRGRQPAGRAAAKCPPFPHLQFVPRRKAQEEAPTTASGQGEVRGFLVFKGVGAGLGRPPLRVNPAPAALSHWKQWQEAGGFQARTLPWLWGRGCCPHTLSGCSAGPPWERGLAWSLASPGPAALWAQASGGPVYQHGTWDQCGGSQAQSTPSPLRHSVAMLLDGFSRLFEASCWIFPFL